ncbi:hypothetical protein IMG5_026890 [Ichthyophthirius multifiliis]|uniref:Uncharacterized protein n=1 Tax=Ichthyophthirius multifiliis TaxID=5932 RepID=G0QL80_ICHMU|nr:hypothetical protein IMG5_026890 [Ichthyophthirius multifiliis]EGR34027.1 hypothetical protein IMG5_026890 [Ichthyophthirius multifiliis]|eukprot:XP_004039331.1 hypothetical protein IMG5_026890 [Ichthyophthirius multifiliis]
MSYRYYRNLQNKNECTGNTLTYAGLKDHNGKPENCTDCEPGYFAEVENICMKCRRGYWSRVAPKDQEKTQLTGCTLCADGFYSFDNETCIECPANHIGSGPNQYGGVGAHIRIACKSCPEGMVSPPATPSVGKCAFLNIIKIFLGSFFFGIFL